METPTEMTAFKFKYIKLNTLIVQMETANIQKSNTFIYQHQFPAEFQL